MFFFLLYFLLHLLLLLIKNILLFDEFFFDFFLLGLKIGAHIFILVVLCLVEFALDVFVVAPQFKQLQIVFLFG